MAIEIIQTAEIIEALENFLHKRRPPIEMRSKVDLAYKIDNQSVIIYEIRPLWDNPKEIINEEFAKATFVNTQNHWKVFWMRSDMKWFAYQPKPKVKTIKEFTDLVDKDDHYCFWG